MDRILLSFSLPPIETATLLRAHSASIAGSAALAALTQKFEPGDIDIWVPSDIYRKGPPSQKHMDAREAFATFLAKYGYEDVTNRTPQAIAASYYADQRAAQKAYKVGPLSRLTSYIQWFRDANGKSIQVIHTFKPIPEVVCVFDVSICATWWDGVSIQNVNMAETLAGNMYRLRAPQSEKEEIERLEKYQSRGFRLISEIP